MKLIKGGKRFDLSKATLIATSQWFMNYKLKRCRFYKSINGQFFETEEYSSYEEIRAIRPNVFFNLKAFHFDIEPSSVIIKSLLTDVSARNMFEHIAASKEYGTANGNYSYKLEQIKYEDIFDVEEG